MDPRDETVDALILKSRDYREQDRMLTFFSLEKGKMTAIARGAGKPGGSMCSIAQPYSRVSLTLSPAKGGISFVSQGLPDTSFITLDASLEAMAYAAYFGELTDLAMPRQKPSRSFFALLLTVFSMLKLDDDPARTARYFELHLLAELGLLPELNCCGGCSRSLTGGYFHLSPQRGDLLCAGCGKEDPSPLICAGTVQTMRRLLEVSVTRLPSIRISPLLMQEMEAALTVFLDYHLDYSSKAKRVLSQLLASDDTVLL